MLYQLLDIQIEYITSYSWRIHLINASWVWFNCRTLSKPQNNTMFKKSECEKLLYSLKTYCWFYGWSTLLLFEMQIAPLKASIWLIHLVEGWYFCPFSSSLFDFSSGLVSTPAIIVTALMLWLIHWTTLEPKHIANNSL